MEKNKTNLDEFSCGVDGNIVEYDAVMGYNPVSGNYAENYMSAEGEADEFYNLFGLDKKSTAERNKRRMIRQQSKAQARNTKAKAQVVKQQSKRDSAKAQQMSAKASEKAVASDVAMANAMAQSTPVEPENKGMSMGMKVGIGATVVLVLGIVGFIIYKKMKKKK